ncbi:hypothetical protein WB388_08505 [Streptomyces brasiliscabiei]|uniref:Uncharacterized protein n=1 Tax=Streptomyces brasiliscabiei TaxID=2736302 RepID=A0ABU8GA08_9ACTN
MNLVSRQLARVRAFVSGLTGSRRRDGRPADPNPPVRNSRLARSHALLAAARHRRAPHLWPAPALAVDDAPYGALVRAYVLLADEATRPASAARRAW